MAFLWMKVLGGMIPIGMTDAPAGGWLHLDADDGMITAAAGK